MKSDFMPREEEETGGREAVTAAERGDDLRSVTLINNCSGRIQVCTRRDVEQGEDSKQEPHADSDFCG